jgi:hypothetical protein
MKTALLQLLLLTAAVVGSVSAVSAQALWTSVGSAGTVDEAGTAILDATGAQVRISATAPLPATLIVRYNVVALDGLSAAGGPQMTVRFKDAGFGGRITAVLKEINFTTGATVALLTVDSNIEEPTAMFQVQQVSRCDGSAFDFSSNAYFIETTITKFSEDVAPSLQLLAVGVVTCGS